jgi:hypothetical protein
MILVSFVLTESDAYVSYRHPSHSRLIRRHALREDLAGKPLLLHGDAAPVGPLPTADPLAWRYSFGQDVRPEWVAEQDVAERCRRAVATWCERCLVTEGFRETDYDRLIVTGGRVEATDCGEAILLEHASGEFRGRSVGWCYGRSRFGAHDDALVKAYDESAGDALGQSVVVASDRATVFAVPTATVRRCGVRAPRSSAGAC